MEENIEKSIQNNMQSNLGYSVENNVPNNVDYNPASNMPNNMQYNMNYNAGNNMGNPMPGQKKGKGGLIALWIILGIVALVVIGVCIAIAVKNVAHDNEIKDYTNKAKQYLSEKYNEEFDVEFVSEQYAAESCTLDATTTTCGTDKNTIEYNFKAKSKSTSVETNVTVYKKVDTGNVNVVESNGSRDTNGSMSYEKIKELTTEVKPKIESELAKYYSSYNVEIDNKSSYEADFIITINESFTNKTDKVKTLIYNTASMLNIKTMSPRIYLKFTDYTCKYSYNEGIAITDEKLDNVKAAILSIKQNLKQNYKIEGLTYGGIKVTINGKIKEEYAKNSTGFEKLYKDLEAYMKSGKETVYFEFSDKKIQFEYYSYRDGSFSNYVGK